MKNKNEKPLTRPPSTVREVNEPNLELMAIGLRNLYYKSLRKEIRQQIEKESTDKIG